VRERRLQHGGDEVEQFYGSLGRPVTVGIESTGYAPWFHQLTAAGRARKYLTRARSCASLTGGYDLTIVLRRRL
jgi:hypothetical protein